MYYMLLNCCDVKDNINYVKSKRGRMLEGKTRTHLLDSIRDRIFLWAITAEDFWEYLKEVNQN